MSLDERCEEGCYYELVEGCRPEFRCHGNCALLETSDDDNCAIHERPSINDKASPEVGPQAEASPAGTGAGTLAGREGRHEGEAASACLPATPGEITIERKPDGSVTITQANLFKLYDDEVTIPADQFATVLKALQAINNEIIERETI